MKKLILKGILLLAAVHYIGGAVRENVKLPEPEQFRQCAQEVTASIEKLLHSFSFYGQEVSFTNTMSSGS